MILLDIEGTTTPIAFVKGTLFPYARVHLRPYLEQQIGTPELLTLVDSFGKEYADDARAGQPVPPWDGSGTAVEAYARWLMDRDRKSPALKDLQGRIWERGYEIGDLVGEVFADVPSAFARWRAAGITLGIFSSGSLLAQQWLFRRSSAGDLSRFIQRYFDTGVGKKQEPASYRRIAKDAGERPSEILFLSDVVAELNAARAAGLRTTMTDRPGNAPQPSHDHPVVRSFDEIASLPQSSA